MATTTEILAARLDVLRLVLQEVGRALAPAQGAAVAEAIRGRLGLQLQNLAPAVDEAIAAELSPLLRALHPNMADNSGDQCHTPWKPSIHAALDRRPVRQGTPSPRSAKVAD